MVTPAGIGGAPGGVCVLPGTVVLTELSGAAPGLKNENNAIF